MLLFLGIPLHPCLHTVPMTVSHPRLLHVKPTLRSLGNPQDVCPCAHAGLPNSLTNGPHAGISITSYAAFAMACTALDCCLLREVHPAGALCLGTGVETSL